MDEIFVTCPNGLETLLLDELRDLGIHKARRSFCGVFIPKKISLVYLVNYCSRIATRVLWPLAHFYCKDRVDLYREARKIDWCSYLNANKTFAIDSNVTHDNLRNSLYASLIVKDALCDTLRDKRGTRPSVNTYNPDVQVNLFIQKNFATISLDTSGAPLFKRGWRKNSVSAPLQESLAAAVLMLANYTPEKTLCDPFCGSGTLLIEAALMATKTPPGSFRKEWGFFHMPEFSQVEWKKVKEEADSKKVPLQGKIFGSDIDPRAIDVCRSHLASMGFAKDIELQCKDIKQYSPSIAPDYVVTNPPYGKRLDSSEDVFRSLGEMLKNFPSTKTYLLSPEPSLAKATGLRLNDKFQFTNGGIKVDLFSLSNA